MSWIELSEGVNLDLLEKQKVGSVLGFVPEIKAKDYKRNSRHKDVVVKYFKIVRIDKKRNKYWARPVQLYDEEEARKELKKRLKK